MEALGETTRLLSFCCEEQLARLFRLFHSQMLNVNLSRFVGEFDLYLRTASTQPQEYLFAIVQNHDIVVRQIILCG